MNRRAFIQRIGLGSIAAASLPWLFGVKAAPADDTSNGHRVYDIVAFGEAPASGLVLPRMGLRGCGTFDARAGFVKGGGSFVLSDQNSPTPKTILVAGKWKPTEFVS